METPPSTPRRAWRTKVKKSHAGLSALDILITVLVLSVILLAAAYQFGAYDGLSAQPVAQSDEAQE